MRFQAAYWAFVVLLVWPASAQLPPSASPMPSLSAKNDAGPHAMNMLPETPAGKAATDWLAAFNSGDPDKIEAMRMKYHLKTPTDNLLQAFRQRGGWDVLRIESSDPGKLTLLLSARDTDLFGRQSFQVDPINPTGRLDVTGQGISPPSEFLPKRLSQRSALLALSARAEALHTSDRFSGGLLISKGNQIIFEKTWGMANRETGEPIKPETKFRIGSMNKMFTAVAILQLVSQRKISLDDTMGKYLSDYPNKEMAQATVRQLLDHTAGAGDIFGPDFDAHRTELKTHADYIALYGNRAPAHAPGASDGYDNYGFILLAGIIERVTGQSYYDYAQDHVLLPAGMKNTGSLPEDAHVRELAPGYMWRNDRWISNSETLPYRGTAAGGGYSTLGDLLKFAQALEAGKLLPAPMLAQATTPQNHNRWYGLGFMVYPDDPAPSYGHEGGAPGMNADLRIFADQRTIIICLSNLDPMGADTLTNFYALRMPVR
jgi:CubicO group peptidase (beta-lactamase class C family)